MKKFQYPKITGMIITILLAYWIFRNPNVEWFVAHLGPYSYLGTFLAGTLYSFGFTSPFSSGFFLFVEPENIFLAAAIGGFGALISDLLIFKLIRFSFKDEFEMLRNSKTAVKLGKIIDKYLGKKIKVYLLYALAAFFIGSPLPDEAGIILLAGLTKIKTSSLSVISFLLNSLGILVILMII